MSDLATGSDVAQLIQMPEDVLLKIFGLLNYRDLYSVGRSCQKFYRLAETFPNWIGGTSIDTKDVNLNDIDILTFLLDVPESVRRLRISAVKGSLEYINFFYLSLAIYLRFPYLEELHLNGCRLGYNLYDTSDAISKILSHESCIGLIENLQNEKRDKFSTQVLRVILPQSLRLLSLRNYTLTFEGIFYRLTFCGALPNLKVVDLFQPFHWIQDEIRLLSSCPNLTELHLGSTMSSRGIEANSRYLKKLRVFSMSEGSIEKQAFVEMLAHLEDLTEFHLCNSVLSDEYLDFVNEKTFPHLEILCMLRSEVTQDAIVKLFNVCHSLKIVYVSVYVDSLPPVKRYGKCIRSSGDINFTPFENIDANDSCTILDIIRSHNEKYTFCKEKHSTKIY